MCKRVALLTFLTLVLVITLAGAQSLPTIPTDPSGSARGAALLCINAAGTNWLPCNATTPLTTQGAGAGGLNPVDVQKWGGTNTSLGQKPMATSVPVSMASDQPALSITGTVGVSGTVTTTGGTTPTSATPSSQVAMSFTRSTTGQTTSSRTSVVWLDDSSALFDDNTSNKVWWTSNRGRDWTQYSTGPTGITNTTSLAANGGVVLLGGQVVGGNAAVWQSTNGGVNWTRTSLFAGVGTSCSVGIHGTTAIAMSTGGIYRSTTSGSTWGLVDGAKTCADGGDGPAIWLTTSTWLLPADGKLYRSADDGQTWTLVLTTTGAGASGPNVGATSTTNLFAAGTADANLYHSIDGGQTWSTYLTFLNVVGGGMACINSQVCIAFVSDSPPSLMRSGDGGVTWSRVGTLDFIGCNSTCIPTTVANSFGYVLSGQSGAGGNNVMEYSAALLGGTTTIVGTTGVPMSVDTSGRVTANQGTAAASPTPWPVTPIQGPTLFNSQTTGAANTAVTVTIANAASVRAHVYNVHAFCSAGTAQLTVTDGGTTIWGTLATEITTTRFEKRWEPGLTSATNSQVVVNLTTCGVANTGTLHVQADRF
jgi:hypothetical protein